MTTNTQTKLDPIQVELDKLTTKSSKIRYLTTLEWKRGDIAKKLGVRYQHVRNVQLQPLKKTEAK